MNKRILLSLSLIWLVCVVVIGATAAYFVDTETSTTDVWDAGTLDLTIEAGG